MLYRWLLPVVFGALVFKLSVWCGAEGYVSGLQAAAAIIITYSECVSVALHNANAHLLSAWFYHHF